MVCGRRALAFRKMTAAAMMLAAGAGLAAAQVGVGYPEIEYAAPDQSVWTARTNAKGEPDNPLFALAAELFAKAGIPWHGRIYPPARMFKYLQDGTAQFSMLVKVPTLQQCCLWSRRPVAVAELRVYRLGSRQPLKGRENLVGKSVIIVRGYSYAGLKDFIADGKNRITGHEAPTHAAAFRMLAQERADYLLDYAGPAAETIAADPVPGLQDETLSRQDVHLVLSRSYPDAERVMARLESIAETLDKESLLRMPVR